MDAAAHVCCAFAAHSPIMDAVAHVHFILRLHGGCLRAAMAMAALDPSSFSFRCSNLTVVYCKIYSIPVRPCQCCYCQSAVMVHFKKKHPLAFHWIFPLCFLAFHPDIFFSLRSCNGRLRLFRPSICLFLCGFVLLRLCLICLAYMTPSYLLPPSFLSSYDFVSPLAYFVFVSSGFILYLPSSYMRLRLICLCLNGICRHLILSSV